MPDLDDLWSDDQNEMIADRLADDHEAGKHEGEPDSRCERCERDDEVMVFSIGEFLDRVEENIRLLD